MTIQQIIDEQMREFDEKFGYVMRDVYGDGHITDCSDEIKSFFNLHTRKLIEAVGKEITGCKYKINPRMKNRNFYLWQKGYNFSVDDSRLKLKEILSNIK